MLSLASWRVRNAGQWGRHTHSYEHCILCSQIEEVLIFYSLLTILACSRWVRQGFPKITQRKLWLGVRHDDLKTQVQCRARELNRVKSKARYANSLYMHKQTCSLFPHNFINFKTRRFDLDSKGHHQEKQSHGRTYYTIFHRNASIHKRMLNTETCENCVLSHFCKLYHKWNGEMKKSVVSSTTMEKLSSAPQYAELLARPKQVCGQLDRANEAQKAQTSWACFENRGCMYSMERDQETKIRASQDNSQNGCQSALAFALYSRSPWIL